MLVSLIDFILETYCFFSGIAYSNGVIRDFAGPYYVSEDNLAFGKTTRYVQLDPTHISGKQWDTAVKEASDEYNGRMHNLCW